MQKEDMSKVCGFKELEMWFKYYADEISAEEFDDYRNSYCSKCIYANKICMYGEG